MKYGDQIKKLSLTKRLTRLSSVVAVLCFMSVSFYAQAREAAFLDPGAGGGSSDEAIKVDPKPEIDIGETSLNVAKRTSVFFVNQTNLPVKVEKIVVNGDANVTAEATADDCVKQGTIDASSRCSVEVSVTPTTPGSWSVDVLMTHNGAGRLTRAHLTGKTSGSGVVENKDMGLAVNSKEIKPVDFGEVNVGDGKTVRSTLMVNDSPEPITIYSIDVIEADNGLQKLDQGCAVDMELAPGASCPVTLLWMPKNNGPVSTDLIIRHSGKMGFAVIPIRGVAKGGMASSMGDMAKGGKDIVPLPPSATDLEKEMAGKIAPISMGSLGKSGGGYDLHLIGTVGERALILQPDGQTAVVSVGSDIDVNGKSAKLVSMTPRSIDIVMDGKRKTLSLEASASLVAKAAQEAQAENSSQSNSITTKSDAPQSVALDGKK
jgi:hypothetical protein